MLKRACLLGVGCSGLLFGCAEQPSTGQSAETQEIINNLVQAGFPLDDILVEDGKVYVGRDAEVSLQTSREMLETSGSKEQYRTTNLIGSNIFRICVNPSAAFNATSGFATALAGAVAAYSALPLQFDMVVGPAAGCQATIAAVVVPGMVGGSAGFPTGGLPFGTINIGTGLAGFPLGTLRHVMMHELGHTIGLRHSDWFNRSISCGTGGDEGQANVGAILIPNTPAGATVGGSIMNSCFRANEPGAFTPTDIIALRQLYGAGSVSGQIVNGATNALVTQPFQVTVEGPGRDLVTDIKGAPKTSFTVTNGTLSFGFASGVNPSENAPVKITLVVHGSGFVSTSLPLSVIGATTFSLNVANLAAPPPGVATSKVTGQTNASGVVTSPILLQAHEAVSNVTATVTIPAGTTITDAAGVPLTGAVTMDGAYFSPTVGSSLASFPGGLSVDTTAVNGSTTPGEFVTAGLMSIEIRDASGRQARNLGGAGMQIAMEIPAGTVNPVTNQPIAVGNVIPIFNNDTTTGRWFDRGTVTVNAPPTGRLVAGIQANALGAWNLDFKQDRCPLLAVPGFTTDFKSRRIIVRDVFNAAICPGKLLGLRVSLGLQGGAAAPGYMRGFTPSLPTPDIIQFINTPKVKTSVIQVFQDSTPNLRLDPGESVFGVLSFFGDLDFDPNTVNNLCPIATSTTTTFLLSFPAMMLPGSC